MNSSPLYKKKISVNGDSICEGVGHPGGYGKIIAERNCMEYQNLGIGGGTVSAEVVTPAGTKRHCISRTVDNMDPDADYAIVEGGVNDASMNEQYGYPSFGELTEGYNGPFDDKTYIGAFEQMLKKLIVKYQGKKIGYIAVHQCAGKYRPTYAGEHKVDVGELSQYAYGSACYARDHAAIGRFRTSPRYRYLQRQSV